MKRKHMLCRLLLAVVLTGSVFVSCEGGDHQTPPPLSGDGGTGGNEPDGGDEPSGSDGYPAGLTVEAFADDLSGGGQCLGFYAVADLKANPKLRFCPQFSAAKRPTEYFADFAASGKGVPCVVVNGGFFGGTTSVSLLVADGELRSLAAQEDLYRKTEPPTVYYPVRAAFGQSADGSFEAVWAYCVRDEGGRPYAFPSPLGNDERTGTFMSAPPSSLTEGGRRWEVRQAVGAGPMLVRDGKNVAEESYWREVLDHGGVSGLSRQPRTAIGATADGKLVVLVCDGRNKRGSKGFTLPELADKLISLGCTEAVNLDGGGSSTFVGREGKVLNMPSDTEGTDPAGAAIVERRIPTAVVIAAAVRPAGFSAGRFVSPMVHFVLQNCQNQINYRPKTRLSGNLLYICVRNLRNDNQN